jgi:hypothetical protein
MALPPLALVSDLAAWVGREIPENDPRAGAVLSASSALVRSYTGQTWVDESEALTEVPDVVSAVVVQVAGRVWVNPGGLVSATIDDGTRRWGEAGSAGLYLTAHEKDVLGDYVEGGQSDLGTLSVSRGRIGLDTIYVPTAPEPSGPPFPWYDAEDFG